MKAVVVHAANDLRTITQKSGLEQAAEAMQVSADPGSGSSKVMLRLG